MYLSERIKSVSESQTIAMARKSRELKARGIDIISLSLGEPDFPTPQPIKDFAKKAIDENFSFYTHVSGYLELRQAISNKFKRDNGIHYSPEQIVVSTGAKQSIANAVLCLINPGDEVIVPTPYWVSYVEIIKLAGGIPVFLEGKFDNDFKITPEQLEKSITSKSRLIMLSTPCNPTGSVYSYDEMKAIAEIISAHDELYLLSDEIYEHIHFTEKHHSFAIIDQIYDRVITINGVSKGFAMTGWRGGIMAGPEWLAKACDKMQGQFTSATCSITQKAMQKAMELDVKTYIEPMRLAFLRRRDLVLDGLKKIPGLKTNVPQGAFYVFPHVEYYFNKKSGDYHIKNGTDLSLYLLEKAHVSVVPGAAFGDDRYIRLSYATSDEILVEAIRRIENALAELK